MTTLDYYNNNADLFICDTKDVEFSDIQKEFISYLPPCSDILDLGCGSGRDSMVFMRIGHNVLRQTDLRCFVKPHQNILAYR